jgi:hypothetical protein
MKATDMPSTTLTINDAYDITVARNMLRKTADAYRWPPLFRARASAALTALAELVLFAQPQNSEGLRIDVDVTQNDTGVGIAFHCNALVPENAYMQHGLARFQLERATDELHINTVRDTQEITARLWIEKTT